MSDANEKNLQTLRDRERILRELIDSIAEERNLKNPDVVLKAITTEGANYTSVLFLVTLKCHNGNKLHLFAKVASVGEAMRVHFNADRLYSLENFFYTNLSKIYKELENKNAVPEEYKFVLPEFFGSSVKEMEEIVVLEDLVAKGYQSYNRFEPVDWVYAAASIESLAKFHALSFAYQKENPEEFAKVCKDLEMELIKPESEILETWEKMMYEKLGALREDLRAKVVKLFEGLGQDAIFEYKHPVMVPVICHGDYRASNLMYKKEGNKVEAIPVDYQTIHTGSPVADLIYYEMLCSDSAFRAENHERLVDYYYQQLGAALQRLNVDVDEVYPRSTFDEEMRKRLPYSVLIAVALLPIVLVEKENAPSLEGELNMEDFLVPTTDLLAERFAGIVEDCDRWGVLGP